MLDWCLILWAVAISGAGTSPSGDLQARVVHPFEDKTEDSAVWFSFSPDGRQFLLAWGKSLRLMHTESGKDIARFAQPKPDWPYGAKLLPDGHTAVATF